MYYSDGNMEIFYLGLIERYVGCHGLSIQACTIDVNALGGDWHIFAVHTSTRIDIGLMGILPLSCPGLCA